MITGQIHIGMTIEDQHGNRGWIVDASQNFVWLDMGGLNSERLDREEVERDFSYLDEARP